MLFFSPNRKPIGRLRSGMLVAAVALFLSCLCLDMSLAEDMQETPLPSVQPRDGMLSMEKNRISDKMQALVELMLANALITEQEAAEVLDQLQFSPPTDSAVDRLTALIPVRKDVENLEDIVEATRENMNRTVDNLLQRDRLLERRLETLEKKVTDVIAARQQKTAWAQRIKISGDLRLRYQGEFWDDTNIDTVDYEDYPDTIDNTIDRERYRYRARLSLKANVVDPREANVGKVDVGLRLATGNTDDPVSTNTTMGDAFNKDGFGLDRAFINYAWSPLEEKAGTIPRLTLTGGRMVNPFFSTNLVWDSDLNFEGVAVHFVTDTVTGNSWRCFLTAGAFPLQEMKLQAHDKWLYGGQIGLEHRPFWGLNYTLAASFYYFDNISGEPLADYDDMLEDDWDWSVFESRQKGNSLVALNSFSTIGFDEWKWALASEFKELNITAMIDIDRFYPIHVILWGDYVINLGYNGSEMDRMVNDYAVTDTTAEDQVRGYMYGVLFGYPAVRNWGEWSISLYYKYLEADAVVDAFTDSDFHGGGTDAEGVILNFQLGLYKNVWLSCTYLTTDEVFRKTDTQLGIDTLQFDVSVKF